MTTAKPPLVDVATQAQWFANVRAAHQMETTEDYVELIADLIDATGEARLSDLAARLGVSCPTVSKMLDRLRADGYIDTQPYRAIFLTDKGRALADACRARHQIIYDFLIRLGVDSATAAFDAEGIEHHISAKTLEIFAKFRA